MILTYRPIDEWPDPAGLSKSREESRFEATWTATLRLLEREVESLGGDEIVLQIAGTARDMRLDGGLRADAKPTHPGVIVSFESRHGPLRYYTDHFESSSYSNVSRFLPGWQANVRAIALGLESLRRVDRYGIAHRGEQYTGWAQLGAGTPVGPPAPMTLDEAARILLVGCDMTASTSAVHEVLGGYDSGFVASLYRLAARRHHPDAGGSAETFRKITEARDLLVSHTKVSTPT